MLPVPRPLYPTIPPGPESRNCVPECRNDGQRTFHIKDILPQLEPNTTRVKAMKLSEHAILPSVVGHGLGLELRSAYRYTIRPWECGLISTDVMICLEDDVHAEIRSSFLDPRLSKDLTVFPVLLPPAFRGNLTVSVHNQTHQEVVVHRHSIVAIMVLQTTRRPVVIDVPFCLF